MRNQQGHFSPRLGASAGAPSPESLSVTRDFPSDYTTQVDRLLAEIFKNNQYVTGIEFYAWKLRTWQRQMIRIGRPRAKRMRESRKLQRMVKSARRTR